MKIAGQSIGNGNRCYIIAELSGNHNKDFQKAVEMIHKAKECGADAVKLQTYTPDTLTIDCNNKYFTIGKDTTWQGQILYELYEKAYTPWDWQPKLKKVADSINITLFSTPFDKTAVDFLENINVPAHKIASFELVDLGLIRYVAKTGKPVILSVGMATLSEIEDAVTVLREENCSNFALLKCVSDYPAEPRDMNLRTIPNLRDMFDVPVGLSDHSMESEIAVAAVSLGASIIEKHFTLKRADGGPDSSFSLEPEEFKNLVTMIRNTEKALGKVKYSPTQKEEKNRVFRRSLIAVKDIKKGELFSDSNIRSIRPGFGLLPKHITIVKNHCANFDIPMGTPITWDHLGGVKDD